MKRMLSFFLSLIMVIGIIASVPITASAASVDDLTFELDNDGKSYRLEYCDESVEGEIIIPDSYNGLPVKYISGWAFDDCTGLTSITIPDSVIYIGEEAFMNCENLTSILIPYSVTRIDDMAFYNTGYYNDGNNWENGVLYIGNHLIKADESINGSYTIKDGTKSIADSAFNNCYNLNSVTIPGSVEYIGNYSFGCCENLTSVTLSDGIKSIGTDAFISCSNLTSITIPDTVTSIGDYAFADCINLSSIIIPDSVTSIGDMAFYNTGYYNESSNWDNDVLYINNHLIEANDSLSGDYEIKDGTKAIADFAFYDSYELVSITIPDSVVNIGIGAFYNCESLTSAIIGDGVTSIGNSAFSNCYELTSITIPDGVTSIEYEAFYWCESLESITIPDSVTSIGDWVFGFCGGLTSFEIPDGLTDIGYGAFYCCDNLTSITIPASVLSIGDGAFYGCRSLEEINVDTANSMYCSLDGVLFNKNQTKLISYPAGKSDDTYTIPDSVLSINDSAFEQCSNLTSVIIPESITNIGECVFGNCINLESVTMTDGMTSIGYCAFQNCEKLTTVTLPVSVSYIGFGAFDGCRSLGTVNYSGTLSQWKEIEIDGYNEYLTNAYYSQFNPPATPKLKSVSNAVDGVKVVWNAAEYADSYVVYRKTAKSGWTNLGTVSTTSFTDKTAKSGTTYYYTVRAKNEAGTSGYNKTGLAIKYIAAPKLSKVYNNGAGNVLSWGKVSGASGYYVYRKTPSSSWSKIATIKKGTTASYTDKKVTYGKTYIYTVKAYSGKTTSSFNANGITILKKIPNVTITTKNVTGGKRVYLSSSISGATIYYKTSKDGSYKKYTGDFGLTSTKTIYTYAVKSGYYKSSTASKKVVVTKAKTPTISVANCVGGKKITLKSDTPGATVYYKTSKDGSYVKYTEPFVVSSTKTVYAKTYAKGYATSSTTSKAVSVSKIGTPTGLTVKSYASTSTKINWKKVSGAQGYYIYRATEKDGTYTLVHKITSGSTVAKTDTGLNPSTAYYYKVRAYCSGKATSGYSSVAGATTKPTPTNTDVTKFFNGLGDIWGGAYLKLFAQPGDKNFKYDTIYCMKNHTYDFYSNETSYKSYITLSSTGKKSTVKISSIMSEAEYKKYINRSNYDHWRVYKVSELQAILDKTWAPGTFKVKDWVDGKDHIITSKGYFLMNLPNRGLDSANVVTEVKSCEKIGNKFYLEVYMLNYDFWGERIYDVSTDNYVTVSDYGYEHKSIEEFCNNFGVSRDELGTVSVVITETSSGLRLESMS